MFKPETPEANAYLQTLVDDAYQDFCGDPEHERRPHGAGGTAVGAAAPNV